MRREKSFIQLMPMLAALFFILVAAHGALAESATKKIRILAWGSNDTGQLGSKTDKRDSLIPVWATEIEEILKPDFDILQIEGGQYVSCLLRSDKTVWCWGSGDSHSQGPKPPSAVSKIANLPPIERIEMGSGYTYRAIDATGRSWHWDRNNFTAQLLDVQQAFGPDLKPHIGKIFWGMEATCGIDDAGGVYCAREKYEGTTKIPLDKKATGIRVGFRQSCALTEDGAAWCWENTAAFKPQRIFPEGVRLKQILTAWEKGCALKDDATVWCWKSLGWNREVIPPPEPVRISRDKLLTDIVKVVNQGNSLFCALRSDGSDWCWDGPTGDIAANYADKVATRVKSPDAVCNLGYVSDVAVGANTGFAVLRATDEEYRKLEIECIAD